MAWSIFNQCDIIGLKICRIRWKKTQNKGYYGVQGHSRSSRSVYRKPVCDFRGMDASAIRTPLGEMGETRLLCGPFSGL